MAQLLGRWLRELNPSLAYLSGSVYARRVLVHEHSNCISFYPGLYDKLKTLINVNVPVRVEGRKPCVYEHSSSIVMSFRYHVFSLLCVAAFSSATFLISPI
jgi:hypothetical protein